MSIIEYKMYQNVLTNVLKCSHNCVQKAQCAKLLFRTRVIGQQF
jgi:hypothetical protein